MVIIAMENNKARKANTKRWGVAMKSSDKDCLRR